MPRSPLFGQPPTPEWATLADGPVRPIRILLVGHLRLLERLMGSHRGAVRFPRGRCHDAAYRRHGGGLDAGITSDVRPTDCSGGHRLRRRTAIARYRQGEVAQIQRRRKDTSAILRLTRWIRAPTSPPRPDQPAFRTRPPAKCPDWCNPAAWRS